MNLFLNCSRFVQRKDSIIIQNIKHVHKTKWNLYKLKMFHAGVWIERWGRICILDKPTFLWLGAHCAHQFLQNRDKDDLEHGKKIVIMNEIIFNTNGQ